MPWIEADTQQMGAVQSRVGAQLFVEFREVAGDAGTKVGKWATSVNKSDEENIPAILVQRNMLAVLVGECEIRNVFAGVRHVLRGWRGCRRTVAVSGDFDIFQPVI